MYTRQFIMNLKIVNGKLEHCDLVLKIDELIKKMGQQKIDVPGHGVHILLLKEFLFQPQQAVYR